MPSSSNGSSETHQNGSANVAKVPENEDLLLWRPSSIEGHHLELLRKEINEKYADANLENYQDLHRYRLNISYSNDGKIPDVWMDILWCLHSIAHDTLQVVSRQLRQILGPSVEVYEH